MKSSLNFLKNILFSLGILFIFIVGHEVIDTKITPEQNFITQLNDCNPQKQTTQFCDFNLTSQFIDSLDFQEPEILKKPLPLFTLKSKFVNQNSYEKRCLSAYLLDKLHLSKGSLYDINCQWII